MLEDNRIAFVDANWLMDVYFNSSRHDLVRQWAEKPSTLVISEAVIAECRCNFWRVGDRIGAFDSDLRARRFMDCGYSFREMTAMADELFRRYAPRCNVGTLDLMHIAAAKKFGCKWFLSFDSNSGCRAVAAAEKLKIYPPLNSTDKKLLAKLK